MLSWMFAVTIIISTWALLGLLLFGTGRLLREAFRPERLEVDDAFRCLWLGFAAVLVYLQLWHFWYPIDWRAIAALGAVGAIGLIRKRYELISLFCSHMEGPSVAFVTVLGVVVVWFADRAIGPIDVFDSGNYHLPVIRWSTTYPIVKGLGNVDGHLAFNSGYLLYQAMLEVGFWYGRSSHIANGFLLLVLALFSLVNTRRVFLDYKVSDGTLLFPVVLLMPVLVLLPRVATPSTDLPAAVILFVITWCLLKFAFDGKLEGASAGTQGFHLFVGTTLCAVAVCVKLSNLFYAGGAFLVFLVLWLRRRGLSFTYRLRMAGLSCFTVFSIGLVWVVRNILLSGYPFFPSLALQASVPWRIPEVYAEWYGWWITSWAQTQDLDHVSEEGLSWIAAWTIRRLWNAKTRGLLPLLLAAAAVTYLVVQLRRRDTGPRLLSAFKPITWAPFMVALPAWFFIAPNFRFGSGILWAMVGQALTLVFWTLSLLNRPRATRGFLICVSAMPVIVLLHQIRAASKQFQGSISTAAVSIVWTSPGPDFGLHPVYQSAFERVVTSYGVVAYQPRERDCKERGIEREKWRDCVMWNGPIPGAQRINENLAYIAADTLAAGFVIREPDPSWAKTHSDAVVNYQREHKSNIRQLAYHFRVSPNTIREALARESNAAMSR